jgi:hypothetical protein
LGERRHLAGIIPIRPPSLHPATSDSRLATRDKKKSHFFLSGGLTSRKAWCNC